jgi:hypothetical protein
MQFLRLVATALLTALVGCAVGSTEDDNPSEPDDEAGTDIDASGSSHPFSTDASVTDAARPTDAAKPSDALADTSNPPGPAPDAGSDAAACVAPQACSAAVALSAVSADTGRDTRSAKGTTSEWVQVLATEDDGNVFGKDLRIKATLDSPPGTNFDLYLYRGPDAPALACSSTPKASSVLTTGTDTVTDLWSDNTGHNDAKVITFEVRHVSGPCDGSAQWTLTVTGDTN